MARSESVRWHQSAARGAHDATLEASDLGLAPSRCGEHAEVHVAARGSDSLSTGAARLGSHCRLAQSRVRTRLHASEREIRFELQDLPDTKCLPRNCIFLFTREPAERINAHFESLPMRSPLPDSGNNSVNQQDREACRGATRNRSRHGLRNKSIPRKTTDDIAVEVR